MKLNIILFFSIIALFMGCNEKGKRETQIAPEVEVDHIQATTEMPVDVTYYIERIPAIAEKETLSAEFPQAKIEKDFISINEGMENVKVVWLNRGQKNELRIDFRPEDSTKVYRVTVEGRDNIFVSKRGVKLGMTIDELNSINRKAVDFYGFGWDFGGAAKFNNGTLEDKDLFVFFKTDKKYDNQFTGDNSHTFEEAKTEKLDLYVNRIIYEPAKSNHL